MNKKIVETVSAPAAIGPYSQAVQAGNVIYISGQLPVNPETGSFSGEDIETQTRQSLKNIQAILKQAGTDMSAVVKTTVYLADMDDFSEMNKIYGSFFQEGYPARAAIQVARLPRDAKVEIEAIAYMAEIK